MVEGGGLENRSGGNSTEGSNPSLSARRFLKFLNKMDKEKEWIYGVNPLIETIRSGRNIYKIYISSGRREKRDYILRETHKRDIELVVKGNEFFDSRFPKGHQGIAALVESKKYLSLDELLEIPSKRNENAFFVVLDCIEDPRNVGAIIRTAEAAGAHGMILQAYRSSGIGPEVVKTSAGAIQHMPVSIIPNIKQAIKLMKERDIQVIGAEAGDYPYPWEIDLAGSLGIVVGSEGKGLRRTIKDSCDIIVSLPMRGKVNSLNVSVATGILLFEILRQRLLKFKKI